MKTFATAAGFAIGASAAALRRDGKCCFQLTAAGGKSGSVGQLGDGQNRIGGGYSPATYCLNGGAITDESGRGCILTTPTTQFQCDTEATPTTGFSVSGSGEVEYNGSSTFYACGATDSEYNIYTTPVSGQKDCAEITLSTGGQCSSSGAGGSASASPPAAYSSTKATAPAPSAPAPSAPALSAPPPSVSVHTVYTTVCSCSSEVPPPGGAPSSAPAYSHPAPSPSTPAASESVRTSRSSAASTSVGSAHPAYATAKPASGIQPAPSAASGSACQTSLVSGSYETPHLIVPVSSNSPDTSYGTSYNSHVNETTSTVFNFDIPQSYEGKTCSLIFLFPQKSELETSDYTFNGQGSIDFARLSGVVSESTTYNSCPSTSKEMGSVTPHPGNSYVVSSGACAAGTTESVRMSAAGGLSLNFFEDWNPSPLGLFITVC